MENYIQQLRQYVSRAFVIGNDDSSFHINETLASLEEKVIKAKNSKKKKAVLDIIRVAKTLDFPAEFSIAMVLIAGTESDWIRGAVNEKTKAAGYFQLHPKYFATSGPSLTDNIIAKQLSEVYRKSKRQYDMAALYGHHFFPALGRNYATNPALGIQVGSSYGQYTFMDASGAVFHSPWLMALYAKIKFEATFSVSLDITVPNVRPVLNVFKGNKVIEYSLELGENGSALKVGAPGAAYSLGRAPVVGSTVRGSLGDSAPLVTNLGSVSSIVGYDLFPEDDVEGQISLSLTSGKAYITEGEPLENLTLTTMLGQNRDVFLHPLYMEAGVASLLRAIDLKLVDTNILTISTIAALDQRLPSSSKEDDPMVSQRRALNKYMEVSPLISFLLKGGSVENPVGLMGVLAYHIKRLALVTLYSQLQHHKTATLHFPVAAVSTADSGLPTSGMVLTTTSNGVLWPFSLLCTPVMGSGPIVVQRNFSIDRVRVLYAMAHLIPDPGVSTLKNALRDLIKKGAAPVN